MVSWVWANICCRETSVTLCCSWSIQSLNTWAVQCDGCSSPSSASMGTGVLLQCLGNAVCTSHDYHICRISVYWVHCFNTPLPGDHLTLPMQDTQPFCNSGPYGYVQWPLHCVLGFLSCQPVVVCVGMEGPWIQKPVRVTVQVVSVELTVKVSAVSVMHSELVTFISWPNSQGCRLCWWRRDCSVGDTECIKDECVPKKLLVCALSASGQRLTWSKQTHTRTPILVLVITTAKTGWSIQGVSQQEATRLAIPLQFGSGTPAISMQLHGPWV